MQLMQRENIWAHSNDALFLGCALEVLTIFKKKKKKNVERFGLQMTKDKKYSLLPWDDRNIL